MADQFDWDDVHVDTLPSGWFRAKWFKCATEEKSSTDKRMIRCTWKITEPEKYEGLFHNETFVVGKDEPGRGMEIDAKAFGTRRFKEACIGSGVALKSGMELTSIANELNDRYVMILVNQYTEPDTRRDGSPNEYAGQIRARTNGFASTAMRQPEVFDQGNGKVAGAGVSAGVAGGKDTMVPCMTCQAMVPLKELDAHILECQAKKEAAEQQDAPV